MRMAFATTHNPAQTSVAITKMEKIAFFFIPKYFQISDHSDGLTFAETKDIYNDFQRTSFRTITVFSLFLDRYFIVFLKSSFANKGFHTFWQYNFENVVQIDGSSYHRNPLGKISEMSEKLLVQMIFSDVIMKNTALSFAYTIF